MNRSFAAAASLLAALNCFGCEFKSNPTINLSAADGRTPAAVECRIDERNPASPVDTKRACLGGLDQGVCEIGYQFCRLGPRGPEWGDCVNTVAPTHEVCDGLDNDCDGATDEGLDGCVSPIPTCDPMAVELCDRRDNNCNGAVDEGCDCLDGETRACGTDVGECVAGRQSCDRGHWGLCVGSVGPDAERCGDGADNNCNGSIDEGCGGCAAGAVRECGSDIGACTTGTQMCNADGYWDLCDGTGPADEVCDGVDNNCNGAVDEGCGCAPRALQSCRTGSAGACEWGTQTCDDAGRWSSCTTGYEPIPEVCGDGRDNDCNGVVDNGCACAVGTSITCSVPETHGLCRAGLMRCLADGSGYTGVCEQTVFPTVEDCGPLGVGNGTDENCNGETDEGCECTPAAVQPCVTDRPGVCHFGTQTCDARNHWGLCTPPAPVREICNNGLDDDCDGRVDNGCTCRPGTVAACDTDSPGVCRDGAMVCTDDGEGFTPCLSILTPERESCADGLDNDCDGVVNNGCRCAPGTTISCVSPTLHGVCAAGVMRCLADGSGFTGVCEQTVFPTVEDCGPLGVGNGVDEDCDGLTDETCECTPAAMRSCVVGLPGDCHFGTQTCGADNRWGVCFSAGPVPEVCGDGRDNDCDGVVDNGCRCVPGTTIPCTSPDRRGMCAPGTMRCLADGSGYTGVCEQVVEPRLEDCGPLGTGNGVDENCNGETDEGCECTPAAVQPCVTDRPGVCHFGTQTCDARNHWGLCTPPAPVREICNNGLDDDCDGRVDNGCTCRPGASVLCVSGLPGDCSDGFQICRPDGEGYGPCVNSAVPEPESCGDGRDNDCDGVVDNGCACNPSALPIPCTSPDRRGVCASGTMRCLGDGSGYTGICEPTVAPTPEDCGPGGLGNGLDENCNGETDEICHCLPGSTRSCVTIFPGDCRVGTETCAADRSWGACLPPASSPEVCGDGRDNDCDGNVDNGCRCRPGDSILCVSGLPGDCSDGSTTCLADGSGFGPCVNLLVPSPEVCGDGRDNDCDGNVDNGCRCAPGTTIPCTSPDRRGICAPGTIRCLADGSGYASVCEPAATPTLEDCGPLGTGNGLDEDCDGETDEGCECTPGATRPCLTSFPGDCRVGTETCAADNRFGVCIPPRPAPEICGDGNDNDCDGVVDNGCRCAPGATLECATGLPGLCNRGIATCLGDGSGFGPCVPTTFGPPEVCDRVDNNCDGRVDEGCACAPGSSVACNTGGAGECAAGDMTCAPDGNGYGPCVPRRFPMPEVCGNGLDEDCDFAQDEPPCP